MAAGGGVAVECGAQVLRLDEGLDILQRLPGSLALAASTAARPARVIIPAAASFATRRRLARDQLLAGLRGVTSRCERSASSLRARLSIQPYASASSTISS
ncbi:MAG: hypothetical protein U0R71_14470 [Solirubrobacterales bacterium]